MASKKPYPMPPKKEEMREKMPMKKPPMMPSKKGGKK